MADIYGHIHLRSMLPHTGGLAQPSQPRGVKMGTTSSRSCGEIKPKWMFEA